MRQVGLFDAPAPVDARRVVLFIMLNPSTADAMNDDPTSRRCTAFAARWGGVGAAAEDAGAVISPCQRYRYRLWRNRGALEICNLFAWRATDPRDLAAAVEFHGVGGPDPVGPQNDSMILAIAQQASIIVCAWGAHGKLMGRDQAVLKLLAPHAHKIHALGFNADGSPIHPQARGKHRVPDDVVLVPFGRWGITSTPLHTSSARAAQAAEGDTTWTL